MVKRYFSLSIQISTLFMVLVVFIGMILIMVGSHYSKQLVQVSLTQSHQEKREKIEQTFQQGIAPIITTLDFMAFSHFIDGHYPIDEDIRSLNALNLIFQQNPYLVTVYFGNENGDFTMLVPLFNEQSKQRYQAPQEAHLLINETLVNGYSRITFLDQHFIPIQQTEHHDTPFDPRVRPWFVNAKSDGAIRLTEPYFFYFINQYGVSLSRRSLDQKKVVGADFTLDGLSEQLSNIAYTANTQLALFDQNFQLLAQHNTSMTFREPSSGDQTPFSSSIFANLTSEAAKKSTLKTFTFADQSWIGANSLIKLSPEVNLILAHATPENDLMATLLSIRDKQIFLALFMLSISFLFVRFVSNRIAKPLSDLVVQTGNISRFDFQKTRYPKSIIKEVADLTKSIELMEHTLHDLLRLLRDAASNQDFDVFAKTITHQGYLITKAETILLYTYNHDQQQFTTAANHAIIPFKIDINTLVQSTPWLLTKLRQGQIIHLNRNDNVLFPYKDQLFNSDIYLFPLINKSRQLIGVLNLGYERAIKKSQLDKHAFLREVLSFAEIAKDNIDKMQQQKEMLNAFITLIASAIDTKSPYTGGHCQRVPELTQMLAKAATKDKRYFPDFILSTEQWEELMLAAWMHDCGKVTTPEYVVDKATKLETIYDRIHEIRMRFELLKVQAEADYWQAIANGGNPVTLQKTLTKQHQTLDDEFTFVAQCNIGSESMTEQDIARLGQIAQRQWKRTLDDQIGISWLEAQRHRNKPTLPVMENVLADKVVHQIKWDSAPLATIEQEGFVLKPKPLRYNRGELYNLSVRRGTLTEEERFMINDHIIQTIVMLKRLPYPEHLKNVPDIAGGHHERMDGKGYPRGLNEQQLSIPARIMAIADVFEALTSSDRPYKKAKTLTESIDIMTTMATSGHIDPKLYLLFLEQKVYQTYADQFLDEAQRDQVAIDQHIQAVKTYLRDQF
ncbi:HD domain-containing protein [Vibrio sp. V27_P1S3P104]|nr:MULTISPECIES: HD domain-containing phosphohydrolase [Vibrio]NAW68315.1 HD domain-containing protein [Vibrio sp. V28_P6S34P95]NAX03959.1 HD domain-containing protein [Vibrio sp. V30_P3S12P165]NAX36831.1 HD domain-containing protein [Vibrio sp. V27_P1S3P104]NNN44770.1 HD domain-containing protein [Vibrio sp. 1-1(7)]NNN72143.1 HD domain-containing protein [Vibrio sp. 12-2(3-a)]